VLRSKGRIKRFTGNVATNPDIKLGEGAVKPAVENPVKNPVKGALTNSWAPVHAGARKLGLKPTPPKGKLWQ
jgi:hypothetical protein